MSKAPATLALALVVPVLTVLPVASPATASPRPVDTAVFSVPLTGVDAHALAVNGDGTLARSQSARAAQDSAVRGSTPDRRPDVLTAPTSTKEFQTAGVSWDRPATPADLTILLRTHGKKGWSGWTSLEPGASPEAAPRLASEPVYAGPSDALQVRVDVRSGPLPTGLQADLVDPGDSRYDDQVGRAPADTAAADASQPQIYSRAEWGADESQRGRLSTMSTVKAGVLHHTAGTNSYGIDDVPKVIRGLYAYDLHSGWSDIAYNVLIDRFGRAWEGRAGSVTGTVMSGATGGFNPYTYAVSVLGNYETAVPDPAVVDTAARLFAWKLAQYHLDPNGYTRLTASGARGTTSRYSDGTAVTVPVVFAHRDVGYTVCPGKNLYPYMAQIRSKVTAYMQAAILNPDVTATAAGYQQGGTSIRAAVLTDQSWTLDVTDAATGTGVRSFSGSASRTSPLEVRWDGLTSTGAWASPGRYLLTLRSSSGAGAAVPFTTSFTVLSPGSVSGATVTGSFVPLTPARLLDTRTGSGRPLGQNATMDVRVTGTKGIPSTGVDTVLLNLTATNATKVTHLTAWPAGNPLPKSSSLNIPPTVNRAALVAVGVGSGGKISIRNNIGTADVIVDVVGYSMRPGIPTEGSVLTAVEGQRVYDSRTAGSMLGAGEARTIALPAVAGVDPSAVTAVVVNLTVTEGTGAGYLTAYPPGPRPATSSLNFAKGETAANRVVVGVSGGSFVIRNASAGTHVAVDVVGVYAAPSAMPSGGNITGIQPVRVLDTRMGSGDPLGSSGRRDVAVAGGLTGVPTTAKAVLLTVTGVRPTLRSHLALFPAAGTFPRTSDVNVAVGDVRANLALVPVGADGKVTLFNNAGSQAAVLDVLGYVQ